ncbi:MAG TPA: hypothetical protein VK500_03145, partial [Nitrospiraceae bacterium]|nr:hypothetical protein [Nitrospiraceae bacterium]
EEAEIEGPGTGLHARDAVAPACGADSPPSPPHPVAPVNSAAVDGQASIPPAPLRDGPVPEKSKQ